MKKQGGICLLCLNVVTPLGKGLCINLTIVKVIEPLMYLLAIGIYYIFSWISLDSFISGCYVRVQECYIHITKPCFIHCHNVNTRYMETNYHYEWFVVIINYSLMTFSCLKPDSVLQLFVNLLLKFHLYF